MAAANTYQIMWVGQQKHADQFSQGLESVDAWPHSPLVEVFCVEAGVEAIAHLTSDHSIAGVLLDLTPSQQPDFDLLHHLQTLKPQLPVVVIVDHNGRGLQAVQAGAEDYWVRADQVSDTDLVYTLLCAIERRRRSSGDLVTQAEDSHRALNQEQRYQSIFQNVPVSLWEEDWSAVIAMVQALKAEGVIAIDRYLDQHPEFVDRALRQITILDVNNATVVMFKAATKAELMTSLDQVFLNPDTLPGFKQELIALFNGEPGLDTETIHHAFDGEIIHTLVRITFPPPGEESGLVLVSLMDITSRKQAEAGLMAQVRQQQTVARLGLTAMGGNQLEEMFQHTAEQVAAVLEVEFFKVLQLVDDSSHLLLVAGVGWQPGLVGTATVGVDAASQAGFTLRSQTPIYVNDLIHETRFQAPPLLTDHDIVSGMSVAIQVQGEPWGVLGVHSRQVRQFSDDDTHFMQSVASLLALTIERATTQQALQESNRQIVEAQRLAALGRWEYDLVTDHFSWSENCFTVVGLSPAQFVPTYEGYLQYVHPDDRDQARRWMQQAIQPEQRLPPLDQRPELDFEHRWITPQGEVRYLHQRGEVIADASGQPLRLVGTLQDITQRRQTEEILYHQATLLNNAERLGKMGSWDRDLVNDRLVWSEGTYRLFGLAPGTPCPNFEQFLAYVVADDLPRVMAAHRKADEETGILDVEYRISGADGEIRWFYERGNVILNEAAQPVRRLGMVMDITGQKTAETVLRESEERFRMLSKATNDAIWDRDWASNHTWRGGGYTSLFGYSVDDIDDDGNWWHDHIHPDDRQRVQASFQAILDSDRSVWSDEYRFRCQDGSYAYVSDRGYVLRNSEGQPLRIIGGMTNRTEQKNLEAQLLQSQKMEAVGHLAGGIAHDFNNLLTVILGWSEMLMSEMSIDASYRAIATDIYTAGERAADLTHQLLAFSRKQMLAPQIVDLNQLVSNQEKMLRRVIGEDIYIGTELTTPLPAIKVDRPQLEQVILNLAINARDAMPQGGRLTLATTLKPIGKSDCLGNLDCEPGIYVALSVTDTGEGMSPGIKSHIFEPFFTTKLPGKGTGLGLSMVYGVVNQSGGCIEVSSEVGQGSCFKILVPAVEAAIDAPPTGLPMSPQGRETILLVEDEADVRQMAKMTLDRLGYNTLEASNGRAALEIVEQYAFPIDLVITDVVMPELSGREFVDQLRQRGNGVRVLYMSGYTNDAIVRRGVVHDDVSFLQKPFTPSTLAQKVRDILEKPLPNGR